MPTAAVWYHIGGQSARARERLALVDRVRLWARSVRAREGAPPHRELPPARCAVSPRARGSARTAGLGESAGRGQSARARERLRHQTSAPATPRSVRAREGAPCLASSSSSRLRVSPRARGSALALTTCPRCSRGQSARARERPSGMSTLNGWDWSVRAREGAPLSARYTTPAVRVSPRARGSAASIRLGARLAIGQSARARERLRYFSDSLLRAGSVRAREGAPLAAHSTPE